ncbi:hypothetical protein [Methanoregula sp.]|uniref:hypothetical protein n=1 Tax=Methanoregula sp. TaxID=2052170 RepID=UPI00356B1224
MECMKTIRGFHWITKIVIVLMIILLGLLVAAAVAGSYWMSNQADTKALQTYNGLGVLVLSLAWILTQAFLVLLVVLAIYLAVTRVKGWIEKYLDAMLAEREATAATMAAMNEKFTRMEQKLDNIERILEKVGE